MEEPHEGLAAGARSRGRIRPGARAGLSVAPDHAHHPDRGRRRQRHPGPGRGRPHEPILGQQIVPENRGGAGGTLATKQLANSPPDGYTLGISNSGTMGMGPSMYPNAGYDPRKDFAPIGGIAASAVILVVGKDVPARSVAELIELARKEPGKLTYGTGGAGSPAHLAAELFASMAGIKLTHVRSADWVLP